MRPPKAPPWGIAEEQFAQALARLRGGPGLAALYPGAKRLTKSTNATSTISTPTPRPVQRRRRFLVHGFARLPGLGDGLASRLPAKVVHCSPRTSAIGSSAC